MMNRFFLVFAAIVISNATHAFAPDYGGRNHGTKNFAYHELVKTNFPHAATTLDMTEDATYDSDAASEDEKTLVIEFVDMVQSTPVGELSLDEIDLLREVRADFPGDVDGLEAAHIVMSLLYRQIDEWTEASKLDDDQKEEAFRPATADFSSALSAWEKSENPDKAIHMLSILSDQRELFTMGVADAKPDLGTIKCVLRVLSESRERGVDKRASQVYQSISDFDLQPDEETYSLVIPILARSKQRGAPERAEKLLREAVDLFPPRMEGGVPAGIKSDVFNSVVTAYAKSSNDRGPKQAEDLIVYMDTVDADHGSLGVCSPTIRTFTSLIDAYAQQNDWESVGQADRVLNRLLNEFMEGNEDLEPSIATWTIVIAAWARLSRNNRRGAAERAGRLLKRMEDLSRDERISCKPDAIAYVTCMNAYAFSKGGDGAAEADRILREMNEMYLDGDDSMKPSGRSIKVCANAWMKARNMDSMEDLLDDFEDYLGDDKSSLRDIYKSVLFGYSSGDNASRAAFYLQHMIDEGLEPDSACYERVIDAYTRDSPVENLKHSLKLFELMEEQRRAGAVGPTERVYTCFIRALTKGRAAGMHQKANILLTRMGKLYAEGNKEMKPTAFAYNAALNACAECIHLENAPLGEAFKTAVAIFTELRKSNERADQVTYGNMLRCARLLPEGEQKDKFVTATFRLCCEQGYLNDFVIRDLELCATEELRQSLLGRSQDIDMHALPPEWSRMIETKRVKRGSGRNFY